MADTTTATATTADINFDIKDYISNEHTGLLPLLKTYFELSEKFHDQKAAKQLKDGKLVIANQPKPIGASDLRLMKSHIINVVRDLPKNITASERAKKLKKSAERRANMTGGRQQPPQVFTKELVEFFMHADLGTKPDGTGRLQDMSEMQHFFKNGVANLTFGVSLLHVWGYRSKLTGPDHRRIILDENARKNLASAIKKVNAKKISNLEKARASGDAKDIANAEKDLTRFNEGEIQIKDYMILFGEYSNPTQPPKEQLMAFTEVVSTMSEITKARNQHYRNELKSKFPKVVTAPVKKTVSTPVRKSTSPAPVKKIETAPLPVIAPLPTARAASPATTGTKKGKKQ
jgi:hypothetical protein